MPEPVDDGGQDAATSPTRDECVIICGSKGPGYNTFAGCKVRRRDGGLIAICSFNTACVGRCPEGFAPPEIDERLPLLGRYFAAMAAAEAASVIAFEHMAGELQSHGLQSELAARARRAAADEERHYRMAAALARKFGVRARRGVVAEPRPRTLLEIAIENAREGLVSETLGAAVGWWQAAHAGERSIQRAMRRIAADETSHAVLSWDVDAALRARLSVGERAELEAATIAALASFENQIAATPPDELVQRTGLPNQRVAAALFAQARSELWS